MNNTKYYDTILKHQGQYHGFFEETLYKIAYEQLTSKPGFLTPGVDDETPGACARADWIQRTIKQFQSREFQFKPSRITYIPTTNGKMRPLGLPSTRDQIVQMVYKLLIEPFFEAKFLDSSHGFRPYKSSESALKQIRT
jgi:retron-type reverse transcriptase